MDSGRQDQAIERLITHLLTVPQDQDDNAAVAYLISECDLTLEEAWSIIADMQNRHIIDYNCRISKEVTHDRERRAKLTNARNEALRREKYQHAQIDAAQKAARLLAEMQKCSECHEVFLILRKKAVALLGV